jgi:putative ABC transport system ATP-binding protein
LINQPKLLLADEPTGNLDSRTGTEIMELIRSFNQSLGMTVLMVTHEQALAEKYAGRMLRLADGKLVDDLSNHDLSDHDLSDHDLSNDSARGTSSAPTEGPATRGETQ